MEKTFHLDQKEGLFLSKINEERQTALAVVGALSLDMEQARKTLDSVAERQRAFIRHALVTRGVDSYENARAQNGALIVSLADPQAAAAQQPTTAVALPNGLPQPVPITHNHADAKE